MINLIKKDILVSYFNKNSLILLIFYIPFVILVIGPGDPNTVFLFSVFSFVFMMIKTPFSYEIKDKPHIFIQSLPVKKKDIVISKYASIFINFVVGTIYTLAYMWIMSLTGLLYLKRFEIFTILIALGFIVLSQAISLPTHFRFTPKVANFLNMGIYILLLNFIVLDGDLLLRFLSLDLHNFY
ncbi:MAG TPA: ABC-2 transporter permease, partial [Clostridia bacterium]|nr:ABC-2 transporter permease [Clostridia bacterium]